MAHHAGNHLVSLEKSKSKKTPRLPDESSTKFVNSGFYRIGAQSGMFRWEAIKIHLAPVAPIMMNMDYRYVGLILGIALVVASIYYLRMRSQEKVRATLVLLGALLLMLSWTIWLIGHGAI